MIALGLAAVLAPQATEWHEFAREGELARTLALSVPAGAGPHPLLVLRGGGEDSDPLVDAARAIGLAVAVLEPAGEAVAAVRWLRRHAADHALDPARIAWLGPASEAGRVFAAVPDDLETTAAALARADGALRGAPWPLLAHDDFERPVDPEGGLGPWEPVGDATPWAIEGETGARHLALRRRAEYAPPVRSPHSVALLRGTEAGDFVLDARLLPTTDDYPHLDLCLFFGWQDPSHFYYVHLGKRADEHAHSVFLVDGAPRRSIAKDRTAGTPWDGRWHLVRVRRELATGTIEVFFDDLERPVMTAVDKTFGRGRIGLGSFDDTGRFDEIRLRGR